MRKSFGGTQALRSLRNSQESTELKQTASIQFWICRIFVGTSRIPVGLSRIIVGISRLICMQSAIHFRSVPFKYPPETALNQSESVQSGIWDAV